MDAGGDLKPWSKETRMMNAPRLAAIAAAVLVLGFGSTAVAQDQIGATGSDKIKALLLRPAGWKVDWSGPSGRGTAKFVYETRGQEVVVRIQQLLRSDGAPLPKCEREVKISADGMNHDGCMDYGITFLFDAKDQDYPFRGKSPRGYEYKLEAK
jgi:hypothetical protein